MMSQCHPEPVEGYYNVKAWIRQAHHDNKNKHRCPSV